MTDDNDNDNGSLFSGKTATYDMIIYYLDSKKITLALHKIIVIILVGNLLNGFGLKIIRAFILSWWFCDGNYGHVIHLLKTG